MTETNSSNPSRAKVEGAGLAPGWRRRLLWPLALATFGAAVLVVTSFPATCPLRIITRQPCPSCGLTRAARFALVGDFSHAFAMHPLWFPALAYSFAWVGRESWIYVRTGRAGTPLPRPWKWIATVLVIALIGVWIARFGGAFGGPVAV